MRSEQKHVKRRTITERIPAADAIIIIIIIDNTNNNNNKSQFHSSPSHVLGLFWWRDLVVQRFSLSSFQTGDQNLVCNFIIAPYSNTGFSEIYNLVRTTTFLRYRVTVEK